MEFFSELMLYVFGVTYVAVKLAVVYAFWLVVIQLVLAFFIRMIIGVREMTKPEPKVYRDPIKDPATPAEVKRFIEDGINPGFSPEECMNMVLRNMKQTADGMVRSLEKQTVKEKAEDKDREVKEAFKAYGITDPALQAQILKEAHKHE